MGLNNKGADEIYENIKGNTFKVPIGINIAKTHDFEIMGKKAIEDFCYSFEKLYSLGDYIALNISCPNTTEGKTFEDETALDELLFNLKQKEALINPEKRKPILIKLSPDINHAELDNLLDLSEKYKIDGYVISNTSAKRENLRTTHERLAEIGKGGLSGKPLRDVSTHLIGYVASSFKTAKIIGVGGVFSAKDAYEKMAFGASLVQVYTGLIYEGPGLVKRINRDLVKLIETEGYSSINDIVRKHVK
jgi:dihydroorotate dehydrogenase